VNTDPRQHHGQASEVEGIGFVGAVSASLMEKLPTTCDAE
jgi:hypothetical protein